LLAVAVELFECRRILVVTTQTNPIGRGRFAADGGPKKNGKV